MSPNRATPFNYSVTHREGAAVFSLVGDLSLEATATLRRVFWECINGNDVGKLVLDLSSISSLDSTMISLFVATKNVVAKRRGRLVLVGLKPADYQLLEQTHLHHYFDIRQDLSAALNEEEAASSATTGE